MLYKKKIVIPIIVIFIGIGYNSFCCCDKETNSGNYNSQNNEPIKYSYDINSSESKVLIVELLSNKRTRDGIFLAGSVINDMGGPSYERNSDAHSEFYRIADMYLKWYYEQDVNRRIKINEHLLLKIKHWSPCYPETDFILSETMVISAVEACDNNQNHPK